MLAIFYIVTTPLQDTAAIGTRRRTRAPRPTPPTRSGPRPARLEHRSPWREHPGPVPIIEGTLIRLQVEHLHGERAPKPLWLWTSDPAAIDTDIDRARQAFLRRFDLEHTFRFLKQTLGWTTPKLREPAVADRWTWLVIAAHTQLRLARDLTVDLRRPWERPCPSGRLTPARVRRGFRRIRAKISLPARAPKPSRPGPRRPPGIPNQHHRRRRTSGSPVGPGEVWHGQVGQRHVPKPVEQVSGPGEHFRRERDHRLEVEPFGERRAAPVATSGERPVQRDNQRSRTRLLRALGALQDAIPTAHPVHLEAGPCIGRDHILQSACWRMSSAHRRTRCRRRMRDCDLAVGVHSLYTDR
jgi:hypothetical protein